MNQDQLQTLTALLGRAYQLACAATMGDAIDQADAEEVCGETAELIAHLHGGASMDWDAMDHDLRKLAQALKGE